MKNLILCALLMVVGCSTTTKHIWENEVAIAQKEWANYVATEYPSDSDKVSVEWEYKLYLDAVKTGDRTKIHLAARRYCDLVYNMMIPPLPEGSIYRG